MLSNKSRLEKLIILALSLFLAHLRAKQVISLEDYNDCCNSILALTELDHETFASGSYGWHNTNLQSSAERIV
jgi:hypothetical protein